jgi:hypothetical protein
MRDERYGQASATLHHGETTFFAKLKEVWVGTQDPVWTNWRRKKMFFFPLLAIEQLFLYSCRNQDFRPYSCILVTQDVKQTLEHSRNFCVVRMSVVEGDLCILQCTDVRQDGDKRSVPFEHCNELRIVVSFLWVILLRMKFKPWGII